MTQNSKKGVIPNFKLDLSKCKNVEGDFVDADQSGIIYQEQDNLLNLELDDDDKYLNTNEDVIDFNNSSID